MAGLIKLILSLLLLAGAAVYGGDIWNAAKDRISYFTNPELQKASIFDSFKKEFGKIEDIVKEVNENIDNPNFDKKAVLEKGLKIIEESKSKLNEIGDPDETLIEKTFEGLNDLKEGAANLFSGDKNTNPENCQCSLENK